MKAICSLLFSLAVAFATTGVEIYQPGPYAVHHKLYNSLFIWGLDHSVDVWAPEGEGNFPVVYFIPGLAGVYQIV
jgi:hypothetical protein